MSIVPKSRPQIKRDRAIRILEENGVDTSKPALLAMRGYYRDSMGKPGVNDRGLYDDAIIIVAPDEYRTFNANTDPSVKFRQGVAMLRVGVYPFRLGYHKAGRPGGHPALRPATHGEELPVDRDGIKNPRPGVAINIHRGGRTTTSSEGCQTIHPDQWDEFYNRVKRLMEGARMKTINYCLVEQQG